MDENDLFLHFTKLINNLSAEIAELRASVIVLKLYIAHQCGPDKIIEAFQHLRDIEKMVTPFSDADAELRKHLLEMVEALQHWKRSGATGFDS